MAKKINFTPAPGYVLIDPVEQDKKSDYIQTVDTVDRSYKGHVLAIGDPLPDESGNIRGFFAKVGDLVLFSIAGVERTKMEYKGNLRYEFVITPYNRVLGIIE